MTLHEVAEAANIVQEAADPDANIIFGTVVDRALQGKVKVTVIATGFVREQARAGAGAAAKGALMDAAGAGVAPVVVQPSTGFLRRGQAETLDFDATDEGFSANFVRRKDDLDVPAFLRKQMD